MPQWQWYMKHRWIIGVDEVGRGALAGPLTVGAVAAPLSGRFADWQSGELLTLRDSKMLSSHRREILSELLHAHPHLRATIGSISHRVIDRVGMTAAAMRAVRDALYRLPPELLSDAIIFLDGGLIAPLPLSQMTIIHADATMPIVSAASVVAKVHRDGIMVRQHRRFPEYGFDRHKGYGTAGHYEALRIHGPSPIHRLSFRLR